MAIHIEGITVVVRKAAAQRLPRGVETFRSLVTNATFATDGYLLRSAFMDPSDVEAFVGRLEDHGLVYEESGVAIDICVADQISGQIVDAPWLEIFDLILISGHVVRCLAFKGTSRESPTFPIGWTYETSLYSDGIYVPEGETNRLLPISSSRGIDTVIDLEAGKPLYIASANGNQATSARLNFDLSRTSEELYAREEAAIEYARQALLGSGESIVPQFAPPKRWLRARLDRYQNYRRPDTKTVDELVQLYALWRHPAVMVGMVGLLYGRAVGEWAGEVYDALFLERQKTLAEEEEHFKDVDYMDRPCISRVAVPSLFLRRIEEDLPPYDVACVLKRGGGN